MFIRQGPIIHNQLFFFFFLFLSIDHQICLSPVQLGHLRCTGKNHCANKEELRSMSSK